MNDFSPKLGIADMVVNFAPGVDNPLSISAKAYAALSPVERLKKILQIVEISEFDYFELGASWLNELAKDFTFAEIEELLAETDVRIRALCSLVPPNIKTIGPKRDKALLRDYLHRVFANFDKIGEGVIVYGSGDSRNCPETYSRHKAVDELMEFLAMAVAIIRENSYPFKIVLEPLNIAECNFINNLKEAYPVAEALNMPELGIVLDVYHEYAHDVDFADKIAGFMNRIFHVHLSQPENRRLPGFLADDGFDFAGLLTTLKQNAYAGNITFECKFVDLVNETGPSIDFLKTQIEQVE